MSHTTDLLDALQIPYMIVDEWSGPIWKDGKLTYAMDSFGDVGLFHEVCHYLIAEDWQRTCPDLGLGANVNATLAPSRKITKWVNAGDYPSWGDEDRVCQTDAGIQESWSVWSMGLYSLLFELTDDELKSMHDTMGCFGAWNDPMEGPPMNKQDAADIAHTFVPQLKPAFPRLTVTQAKKHLVGYMTEK